MHLESPRRSVRRGFMIVSCLAMVGSCVHPAAVAGRDSDASISGLRAEVGEVRAALVDMQTDLRAGRDVNQNDKWTLRLLGLGVLILGLTYPVGKIVWIASTSLTRRAGTGAKPPRAVTPDDLFAFRRCDPHRADIMVQA